MTFDQIEYYYYGCCVASFLNFYIDGTDGGKRSYQHLVTNLLLSTLLYKVHQLQ